MDEKTAIKFDAIYHQIRQDVQDEVRTEFLQLKSEVNDLNECLQMQMDKNQQVESNWLVKCKSCENVKVNSLQDKLDETVTSTQVLNHHCISMKNENMSLQQRYDQQTHQMNDLKQSLQQQQQVSLRLQQQVEEMQQHQNDQLETIKRYKADLTMFKGNYYSDAINPKKKISGNLPSK